MTRHKLFSILTAAALSAMLPAAIRAQTVTALADFDYTDGAESQSALVQGIDGNLYGTTQEGGTTNGGEVFKITPSGTLTVIYNFCSESNCTDGNGPQTGLLLGTNGNFYGVTTGGGAYGGGTVFEITSAGKLTTIYNFCAAVNCTDGYHAVGRLIQVGANFYGTTELGGANDVGTVFEVTPAGKLTTLWNFCSQSNCIDGAETAAGLLQASNGDFYGTTVYGGTEGQGTVFKFTPSSGTLTSLYSFCSQASCTDGDTPLAPLIQASNGNLYGTTEKGGTVFGDGGTVFEITLAGKLTTVFSFAGSSDGDNLYAGVIQGTDGNLYGAASEYGPGGAGGTLFGVSTGGTLTMLYAFCADDNCATGAGVNASLVQSTNGDFYGVNTSAGGSTENGVVFSLSMGLGPFVTPMSTSGKVGAKVAILGNGFTDKTTVSFNGTAATTFQILKSTLLTAIVPTGATTGPIEVTTGTSTLKSNVVFRVLP